MTDAGDVTGRADPGADERRFPATEGEAPAEGLSKRAARRRRKRRAASGTATAETTDRATAPAADNRKPSGDPVADRAEAGRRRKKRGSRSARPPQGGDGLRGMRAPGPIGKPKDGRSSQGKTAERGGQDRIGARSGHAGGRGGQAVQPVGPAMGAAAHLTRAIAQRGAETGERRTGRRGSGGPLYAALDLGTNNCRLLVAEPQERGFRVVDAFSRIVRLGEGIGRSGRLSEAAMDRAVEALAICRVKMAELDVRKMRLVATEACRMAENGVLFLERVRRETGLDLEIVNRETEARLAVAGCATLVDPQAEGVVLFDIGGGSSELVWLDLRNRGGARGFALTRFIKAWTSLPVGVVTLSERHGGVTVTPAVFEDMVAEVDGMLASFEGVEELAELVAGGKIHMLGTSGTVTTLAGIHLGLKRYDRRRVDGVWLDGIEVDDMVDRLVAMDFADRVANPCIGHDRADLVLAGCAILEAIRRRWPCEKLRVADRGLREGILVELMARDGVWRRRGGQRLRAG